MFEFSLLLKESSCSYGRIVDHHCLEVIVCFLDIGRIVAHHCLEVIVPISKKQTITSKQ
jgi:hypothetical protein